MVTEGNTGISVGMELSVYSLRRWLHKTTHVIKLHGTRHTQVSTSKTGDSYLNKIKDVNIKVSGLYYSLAIYYHWGKLCKEYTGSPC